MLYRLRPGRTDWVDVFGRDIFEAADEHAVDLDRLEWLPTERVADDTTVRLALRSGRASRLGIIVDAGDLEAAAYPDRVRSTHAAAVAAHVRLRPELEKLERIIPGTLAAEDAASAAVDESTERTLARADADLQTALRVPPLPGLVEQWRQTGGVLPDPL